MPTISSKLKCHNYSTAQPSIYIDTTSISVQNSKISQNEIHFVSTSPPHITPCTAPKSSAEINFRFICTSNGIEKLKCIFFRSHRRIRVRRKLCEKRERNFFNDKKTEGDICTLRSFRQRWQGLQRLGIWNATSRSCLPLFLCVARLSCICMFYVCMFCCWLGRILYLSLK